MVGTAYAGDIYRIGLGTAGGPPRRLGGTQGATTFLPGFMVHVLAQDAAQVYWVDSTQVGPDSGRVMAALKATWGIDGGRRIGGIQSFGGNDVGFVGLAANAALVAWAVAPQPNPGAVGCRVYTQQGVGPPKLIFDADLTAAPFLCDGLAIDQDFAYFAMVEVYVPPAGASQSVVLGKGIVRVPLGGGAPQTLALSTDRWYGARRVVLDDTYVYAVDPLYVVRFPKSAYH
jgi:hypothetical protein